MLFFPILTLICVGLCCLSCNRDNSKLFAISIVLVFVFFFTSLCAMKPLNKEFKDIESYTYQSTEKLTKTVTISTESSRLYEKDGNIYKIKSSFKTYAIPFGLEFEQIEIPGKLLDIEYPNQKNIYKEKPVLTDALQEDVE